MLSSPEINTAALTLLDQELIIPDDDHRLLRDTIEGSADAILSSSDTERSWDFKGIPLRPILNCHPAKDVLGQGYSFVNISSNTKPNELTTNNMTDDYEITLHGHPLGTAVTALYDSADFVVHFSDTDMPLNHPRDQIEGRQGLDEQTMLDFLSKAVGNGIWAELTQQSEAPKPGINQAMDAILTKLYSRRVVDTFRLEDRVDTLEMADASPVWVSLGRKEEGKIVETQLLSLDTWTEQQVGDLRFRKVLSYGFRVGSDIDDRYTTSRLRVGLMDAKRGDEKIVLEYEELEQLANHTLAATQGQNFAPAMMGALEYLPSRSPEELLYR